MTQKDHNGTFRVFGRGSEDAMAGSVAIVLGFPLVLMIGMLAMHQVEQMIEKVRRPRLRLVPDPDDEPHGDLSGGGPPPTRLLRLIVSRQSTNARP